MLKRKQTITINNQDYKIGKKLGSGGWGTVFAAKRRCDKSMVVVKQLKDYCNDDIVRLEAISDLQLHRRITGAVSISEVIYPKGNRRWAGYIMPWAAGEPLVNKFSKSEVEVADNLLIATQVAKMLFDAHVLGIVHGDLQFNNVLSCNHLGFPVAFLVDWDNAVIPNVPPPRSIGHTYFLAPELMKAHVNQKDRIPDKQTELCAATKLFHLLLFGRHSYSCDLNKNDGEFERESIKGTWNSDPARGPVDLLKVCGISNEWVSHTIADLFRRGLSRNRDDRPTMDEWLKQFSNIIEGGLPLCPRCYCPVLLAKRIRCPHCHKLFPMLDAISNTGKRFRVDEVIGKDKLRSKFVSRRHALITNRGAESFITDLASKNGTFRRTNGQWVRIKSNKPCVINEGDRIRCADVDLRIVAESL